MKPSLFGDKTKVLWLAVIHNDKHAAIPHDKLSNELIPSAGALKKNILILSKKAENLIYFVSV